MRLDSPPLVLRAGVFQSTHPVWDATISEAAILLAGQISIHASRMGCDMLSRARSARTRHFNPRIPYGMRQKVRRLPAESKQFQSTHPVWDATTMRRLSRRCSEFQSTHPVWDATRAPSGKAFQAAISIHASRMGCDVDGRRCAPGPRFQSTHPVWDATYRLNDGGHHGQFQSTHPVWDATS